MKRNKISESLDDLVIPCAPSAGWRVLLAFLTLGFHQSLGFGLSCLNPHFQPLAGTMSSSRRHYDGKTTTNQSNTRSGCSNTNCRSLEKYLGYLSDTIEIHTAQTPQQRWKNNAVKHGLLTMIYSRITWCLSSTQWSNHSSEHYINQGPSLKGVLT